MNPEALQSEPTKVRSAGGSAVLLLERYSLLLLLVVLIIFFAVLVPDTFLNLGNIRALLQSQSVSAIVAFAVIVPLSTGRFDLSVGATLTICSLVAAGLMSHSGQSLPVAVLVALGVGAVIGVVNGLFVAYVGVDSLIVTLATGTALTGIIDMYSGGQIISSGLSPLLTQLGVTVVGGVLPVLFIVMIAIAFLVWFVLERTPFGRRLQSIGSSESAARLVGINVRRVILASFVASGLLGGVAGVMQIAAQGSANPTAGGINSMLPALAGVFLGATVFYVGRYNVPGTLVGLFVVAVLVNGMALAGAPTSWQPVVNGAAVVAAVSVSSYLRRRRLGELQT